VCVSVRAYVCARVYVSRKNGVYVKDLTVLGLDLRRTVLMDTTPTCFFPQPENGIPCRSFYANNGADNEVCVCVCVCVCDNEGVYVSVCVNVCVSF
jgi:hypothetical protein